MRKNEKITALYERLSRDDFGGVDENGLVSVDVCNVRVLGNAFGDFGKKMGNLDFSIFAQHRRKLDRFFDEEKSVGVCIVGNVFSNFDLYHVFKNRNLSGVAKISW